MRGDKCAGCISDSQFHLNAIVQTVTETDDRVEGQHKDYFIENLHSMSMSAVKGPDVGQYRHRDQRLYCDQSDLTREFVVKVDDCEDQDDSPE